MIDPSQGIYYVSYAVLSALLGVAYVKFKSTEGTTITTKEFKVFQTGFLTGYSAVILCELVAAASFYHTFISLKMTLEQITKLYIVTIVSSTVTGVLSEIVDVGSRKDKCVTSALLYSVSMFSIFFGGHYEMLLIGRIVYGVASSLHHTSFEAYAVHEHSSMGFPDDWLSQTFTQLTHSMAVMAVLSGALGQLATTSGGSLGCVELCCALFALTALYLAVMWEKDLNSPRFMMSGFLYNLNQTTRALRSNKQLMALFAIQTLCESSITIFTFYWAPWMAILSVGEGLGERNGSATNAEVLSTVLPYEVLFSCLVVASMLGNYIFQMYASSGSSTGNNGSAGLEGSFQAVLIGSAASYFLGAVLQTPMLAFSVGIAVQMCIGGYWPSIGHLRGKIVMPELRSTAVMIPRVATLVVSVTLLSLIHHSPTMLLTSCAVMNGAAAYLQNVYMDSRSTSGESSGGRSGTESDSEYGSGSESGAESESN